MGWLPWVLIPLAPVAGGLAYGAERKLKARMQNRIGPPVAQPFYDFLKLMDKRPAMVHSLHAFLGLAHLLVLWAAVGALAVGGDMLIAIFVHGGAVALIVLAAFSVRSVYSHLGGHREALAALAYEPFFLVMAACFFQIVGSFLVSDALNAPPPILQAPLLFVGLLLILPIKLKKSPFDVAEAHQEIVGGAEIEYSGGFFEAVYTAKWLEYVFVYTLVFLFGGSNLWLGAALVLGAFLFVNWLDNVTARVSPKAMLRCALSVSFPLALINLAWLVLR